MRPMSFPAAASCSGELKGHNNTDALRSCATVPTGPQAPGFCCILSLVAFLLQYSRKYCNNQTVWWCILCSMCNQNLLPVSFQAHSPLTVSALAWPSLPRLHLPNTMPNNGDGMDQHQVR